MEAANIYITDVVRPVRVAPGSCGGVRGGCWSDVCSPNAAPPPKGHNCAADASRGWSFSSSEGDVPAMATLMTTLMATPDELALKQQVTDTLAREGVLAKIKVRPPRAP
jgi:hypothetical protein